jgi:plasmid stabilization system protein ParE
VPQSVGKQIRSATGFSGKLLARFSESLDLASQTGSRFQLEDALLLEISRWTDVDARAALDQLLVFIRKQLLPEGARRLILRENILLTIAGSASDESLFPCPSDFSSSAGIITRSAAKQLAEQLETGIQRVCLHGGAGCGKTTVLRQLEQHLSAGSHVVLFDAYGGGRYLDAARVRHRPMDAFAQLSNDMAVLTSLPYFLLRSEKVDARSFLRRLQNAAESLRRINPNALLTLAIDAADNSVTADARARERWPAIFSDALVGKAAMFASFFVAHSRSFPCVR